MIHRVTTDDTIINNFTNYILYNVCSFKGYGYVRASYWNRVFEHCSISDKISDDIWSMIE